MKVIMTVKTEKGKQSTRQDINKTIAELLSTIPYFENKGYTSFDCRCLKDGARMIVEKHKD